MIIVFLFALALAQPTPECPTCGEEGAFTEAPTESGVCCFGKSCLSASTPFSHCRGTWIPADEGISCDDCSNLVACCNQDNAECSYKLTDDCFRGGGTPVDYCELCEATPTVVTTTGNLKPETPVPTVGPSNGGCCLTDGTCTDVTGVECDALNGVYSGDLTSCGDEGVVCVPVAPCGEDGCSRLCCTGITASLVTSPSECANGGRLGAFTDVIPQGQPCGVSCCINAKCSISESQEECDSNGGATALSECSEFSCGGTCCEDGVARFDSSVGCLGDANPTDSLFFLEGESPTKPGVCGSACCCTNGCSMVLRSSCDVSGGVFQGVGSTCEIVEGRDVCMNDGVCCVDGQPIPSAGPIACNDISGVFQGAGTDMRDDTIQCSAGACCSGERGCLDATSEVECRWKDGVWRGEGTTCDMPAICDDRGGACIAGMSCLNMASEYKCNAFLGTWQGVGSVCGDEDEPAEGDGSCCIQKAYFHDGAICEIKGSEAECNFHGGSWNGAGSTCGSQEDGTSQCLDIRGACCAPADETCYDDMSISECKLCGGHFAGNGVSCSDDFVCEPHHQGACCKAGWPCKQHTHAKCVRDGGRFQGFGTTCEGDGVCSSCLPCELDQDQECSSDGECEGKSVCLTGYGKCVIPAMRIPSVMTHPDFTNEENHLGPMSCGNATTIGMSCLVHPREGSCGIGTCIAPPDGNTLSDTCVSVCREIREFSCGCSCRDPWEQSCASIAGHVFVQNDSLVGLEGAVVKLFEKDESVYTFVSEEITQSGGHYAFGGIPGGRYRVEVTLPEGAAHFEDEDSRMRKVDVECLSSYKKRSVPVKTQITYERRSGANHMVEDVDFIAILGPEPDAPIQPGNVSPNRSLLIVVLVILALALGATVCCMLGGRRRRRSRR